MTHKTGRLRHQVNFSSTKIRKTQKNGTKLIPKLSAVVNANQEIHWHIKFCHNLIPKKKGEPNKSRYI